MSPPAPPPSIVWFRRDLRLADNPALRAAADLGRPVLCIYIRDPGDPLAGAHGAAQAWWLHHSLAALDRSLRDCGNRLVTLTGDPIHLIEWLVAETGAKAVFWNGRYDGAGHALDSDIKAQLKQNGVQVESTPGFLLHDPAALRTKQGRHYSVYTPFWKAFESTFEPRLPVARPSDPIPSGDFDLGHEPIEAWDLLPRDPNWATGFGSLWQPGETGARVALARFLDDKLSGYAEGRDFPARAQMSRLSPHLALGEISPLMVWQATGSCGKTSEDVTRFRKELVWREFAWHTLFHNPRLDSINLDRRFDGFTWRRDAVNLSAWKRGLTGYPIVDAGMRELWQSGTMHNRVRMITASFLIKDLLIDWREGERWFRDTLVDADAASNGFNWQWVAGCGADAAPFFRIFNPVLQGEKFDRRGDYVKRWCPELSNLPVEFIHRPFEAGKAILDKAGVRLGKDYPRPIVDHGQARNAALEALKALREVVDRG